MYSKTEAQFESNYQGLKEQFPEQVKLFKYLDKYKYPKWHQFAKP